MREVRQIVPCHCTGDPAIEKFASSYGERFTRCTSGTVIDVGKVIESDMIVGTEDDVHREEVRK